MLRSFKRIVLAALGIGGSLALTMCGGSDTENNTSTACPNGICGAGGSSSSSGGTGGSTSSSSGGCIWLCTPWETGGTDNAATRTCTETNNCGTTANKPTEAAALPALDLNYFRCNVEPILDNKCSMLACHGTETGRALRVYARGRLRHAGETLINNNAVPAGCPGSSSPSASCIGANSCPCNAAHTDTEWRRNYDSARGFGLDEQGNPVSSAAQSDLIQQAVVGGKAHAGIHLFKSGDADHTTLVNWLNGATLATCNTGLN